MLTKRIAAFVNEIVDTIKHDKDKRYDIKRHDKTLATNEAHRELHGEVQGEPKAIIQCKQITLNISKLAGLPLSSDDHQLANNFGEFFTNKINAIRLEIANQVYSPYIRDANGTVTDSTFSEFNVLSESEVHGLIISSSKNNSCPLDLIPTKLVIEFLHVLLPPITNLSLDSVYFPRACISSKSQHRDCIAESHQRHSS